MLYLNDAIQQADSFVGQGDGVNRGLRSPGKLQGLLPICWACSFSCELTIHASCQHQEPYSTVILLSDLTIMGVRCQLSHNEIRKYYQRTSKTHVNVLQSLTVQLSPPGASAAGHWMSATPHSACTAAAKIL